MDAAERSVGNSNDGPWRNQPLPRPCFRSLKLVARLQTSSVFILIAKLEAFLFTSR
jgi:hypothetical protein